MESPDVIPVYSVLFVDDTELLLDIGKQILEISGHLRIDTAVSAAMAMEKLSSRKYDGVISDYEMPGMNGIELLHQVRAEFGNIPFILFTNDDTHEVCTEALDGGADFYLKKSLEQKNQFIILDFMIRHAIELKRTRDKIRELQGRKENINAWK
jgi:CheY-like chemotaxis protein